MYRPSRALLLIPALAGALAAASGLAEAPGPAAPAADPATTAAPDDADAVVLVSGTDLSITADDVEAELRLQRGRAVRLRDDPEALRAFVEQMTRMELLAKEAERRGYGDQPPVVQAVKEEAVQELHRTLIDQEVTPASIPLKDITAYYEENEARFKRPAMRRARHILLEKQSEARALLAEARKASDREFQQLAREHSIDTETKQRGGDLRFFARGDDPRRREAPVHPALRKAAFSLAKLGDTVKAPIEVDGRYSILRLTGIRQARETTLAQAEPSIRTRLWRERRKQALAGLLKRLKAELKPQVFAKRIEEIDLTDVATRPGGFAPDPVRARRQHDTRKLEKREQKKP